MGDWKELNQGVNYSQNFHAFPNLTYSITFQFMFPKYLIELQNVKVDGEIKYCRLPLLQNFFFFSKVALDV